MGLISPLLWHRSIIFGALICLVFGILAGLVRAGLPLTMISDAAVLGHGPLMIPCFLGALISMERAVALKKNWGFPSPLLAILAGISIVIGFNKPLVTTSLLLTSEIIFLGILWALYKVQPKMDGLIGLTGGACLILGTFLMAMDSAVPDLVPWWMLFLVLTIAGERLELSRFVKLPRWAHPLFVSLCSFSILGAGISFLSANLGRQILGASLLTLALWLLQFDIARKTYKTGPAPTRFASRAMLLGYVWLVVGGTIWLISSKPNAAGVYDAVLHSVFLGFVFSMIFAHAPIVLPSVIGKPLPFHSRFYSHLLLLHVGVAGRVISDLLEVLTLRAVFTLLNVLALLLFFANTIISLRLSKNLQH
jgi:hypothetical protein